MTLQGLFPPNLSHPVSQRLKADFTAHSESMQHSKVSIDLTPIRHLVNIVCDEIFPVTQSTENSLVSSPEQNINKTTQNGKLNSRRLARLSSFNTSIEEDDESMQQYEYQIRSLLQENLMSDSNSTPNFVDRTRVLTRRVTSNCSCETKDAQCEKIAEKHTICALNEIKNKSCNFEGKKSWKINLEFDEQFNDTSDFSSVLQDAVDTQCPCALTLTGFISSNFLNAILTTVHWSCIKYFTLKSSMFIEFDFSALNNLPYIKFIDISQTRNLHFSSCHFDHAANIRILNVSSLTITHLPPNCFSGWDNLEHLDLSYNLLGSISDSDLMPLVNLRSLNISFNPLAKIDELAFNSLSSLKTLVLWECNLENFPNLSALSNLIEIDLDSNFLSVIPKNALKKNVHLKRMYINNNNIMEIKENTFAELHDLEWLWLNDNQLSNLHGNVFRGLSSLNWLRLSSNGLRKLTNEVFKETPQMEWLDLTNNKDIYLESTVFFKLKSLKHLWLSDCYLRSLPNLSQNTKLSSLWVSNHRFSVLNFKLVLRLPQLTELDMNTDKYIGTIVQGSETILDAGWQSSKIRILRLLNVDISDLKSLIKTAESFANLEVLEVGWPFMRQEIFPIGLICGILTSRVKRLSIEGTAYENVSLCNGKHFQTLSFSNNKFLESLSIRGPIQELNVSGCLNLHHLDIDEVRALDISHTKVEPALSFCTFWGTNRLIAQHLSVNKTFDASIVSRIVRNCMYTADVIDIWGSEFLSDPKTLSDAMQTEIVLGDDTAFSRFGDLLPSRNAPPMFQTGDMPVICEIQFSHIPIRLGTWDAEIMVNAVMTYRCDCAPGFSHHGDKCVPKRPNIIPIIAGSVFGTIFLTLFVTFITRQLLKNRNYRKWLEERNELNDQLLEHWEEEVIALKQGWEIKFSELRFQQRIAEGSFGIVYKAIWDTVLVAVKILKHKLMMMDDIIKEEFEKEVTFLQRARHPNLVRFFGAGTNSDGAPFLVLEYVAFGSLEVLLQMNGLQECLRKVNAAFEANDEKLDLVDDIEMDTLLIKRDHFVSSMQFKSVWDLKLGLLVDISSGMEFIHNLGHIHR